MIFTVRFVMGVSFAKDSTEEVFLRGDMRKVVVSDDVVQSFY
jgi:hypothetical protein